MVVEIVGSAGAGKTTLLQVLGRHNRKFCAVFDFRRIRYYPFFAGSALLLLPTLVRLWRLRKRLAWREIRMMIHLRAMPHILEDDRTSHEAIAIVDQGPIYMLSRLHESGFGDFKDPTLDRWWSSVLDRWAAILDLVIWLDASDVVLVERIHARAKLHSIKGKSQQQAYDFLARFRRSYEQIISGLTARGGPRIVAFQTDQQPLQQILQEVLAAFDSGQYVNEAA